MYTLTEADRTWLRECDGLLEKHRGKFAVIVGDKVIDIVDTREEAIVIGWDRACGPDFLPAHIVEPKVHLLSTLFLRENRGLPG